MNQVVVGFDVDGVIKDITSPDDNIRCNERIRTLVVTLKSFKNVWITAWSKRGAEWAEQVCQEVGLTPYVDHYELKGETQVDIAIDDEHNTQLGLVNMITNELGHKEKDEWWD